MNHPDDSRCEGASTVLLLIIPNPSSSILPHSLFYRLFSAFGEVEKILIFEKSRLWKAFVEMQQLEHAQQAQQALNGSSVVDGGVMNVYFSTFRTVTLVNNNSGGVDYRQLKHSLQYKEHKNKQDAQVNNCSVVKILRKPLRLRKENYNPDEDIPLQEIQKQQLDDISEKTQIESPASHKHIYDDDCLLDLLQQQIQQDDEDRESDSEEDYTQQERDIMNAFSNNSYNFMFSVPELTTEPITYMNTEPITYMNTEPLNYMKYEQKYFPFLDPANYVNPQFLIENQPSRVIYVRGLHSPTLSPIHLFNLFSNCGNIVIIIFIRHKFSALLQFQKLQHAQNAKDHLNNQTFLGAKLRIFYSNYQEIQLPLPYSSPLTQVFVPTPNMYRFGDGRSIVFNPPSQVLHISNIQKEVTKNEQVFRQLFNTVGDVLAIKFMNVQKQKHMALVRMSTIYEALRAASELHGFELMGRKINISFTKSKL